MADPSATPLPEGDPPHRLDLNLGEAQFNGPISLGTWNARGLFCVDANLQGDKTRHVLDLARRLDILGIVETHDDGFRGRYIQTELMESHNCAWHPLSIDGRAGGCALLVKRSLMSKFDTIRFPRHTPGRHLEAHLRGPAGNLVVHLLHIDPSLSLHPTAFRNFVGFIPYFFPGTRRSPSSWATSTSSWA